MFLEGKRGSADELWKTLFSLLLIAAVGLATLAYVDRVTDRDVFFKEYYARDNALLIESVIDAPGELWVAYPLREGHEGNFDFRFERGLVSVFTSGEGDASRRESPFALSNTTGFVPNQIIRDEAHVIVKENQTLRVEVFDEAR